MSDSIDLYFLLKNEKIDEFNTAVENVTDVQLQNLNLRFIDLQNANLMYADLRGSYFSRSDLRGVNLSHAKLEGCSFHSAKISGVYFPKDLSADEIHNSVLHGLRVRTSDSEPFNEGVLRGKSE